jgi:hypothetical protein
VNSPLKERLLRARWWLYHMNRRQLRRWLYGATRPPSYPYISGDGFRSLANHVYDETNHHISAWRVRQGDVVFVCTDYARTFFDEVDPEIRANYVLITHNSDVPADASLIDSPHDKIIAWFAQNNTYDHPKVVPVPIGLENLHYYHVGVPREYTEMRNYSGPKEDRILAGFTIATNPKERQQVHDLASAAPCVTKLSARLQQGDYLKTLVRYKFLLSPPGNGLDTHRTWEAMYLGVVPIVKDSIAMRSFGRLGLPIWILRDWDELLLIKEQDLEAKYDELKAGFRNPALFMDYWRRLIRNQRAAPVASERRDARPESMASGQRRAS